MIRCIPKLLAAAAIAAAALPAAANSEATWKSISAKAAHARGAPVRIQTNYWLAWTGAWDTVVMKESKIAEKWLPKGSTIEWKRPLASRGISS